MKNFKILQEKENQLFNRKEIQLNVEAEISPSRKDVKKLISEKFSVPIENIRIKKIHGKFGSRTFTITANIYVSEEDKNKTEIKTKKQKKAEVEISKESTTKSTEESTKKSSQEDSSSINENQSSELKASDFTKDKLNQSISERGLEQNEQKSEEEEKK